MKTMLVALWLRNTSNYYQGASIDDRLDALEEALAATEDYRKVMKSDHAWAKPPVLFVAPEYLFGYPTGVTGAGFDRILSYTPGPTTSQTRHLDEAAANDIFDRLKVISARYPSFVIVPGTIAWYRRFKDLAAKDPGIAKKLAQRIVATRKQLQPTWHRDDPLAPTPKALVKTHKAPSTDEKVARLKSFDRLMKGEEAGTLDPAEQRRLDEARLCLNTAVVLYEGKARFVYSKQGDFHEVLAQYQAGHAFEVAIPGEKEGFFEIEGVPFGIEICFDHALGAVHKRKSGWFGSSRPVVHIITSAKVKVDVKDPAVGPKGFIAAASCDGSQADTNEYSGLWYHEPKLGLVKKKPNDLLPDAGGSPLWFYKAPIF